MALRERLFVVIPCAGVGQRAGTQLPKQYRIVAGHHLLYHTLAAFDACSELTQTLVVLARDDAHFDSRHFSGLRFAVRRCGGESRQESVLNGLNALAEFGARVNDWVLVHDAARAGIQPELIRLLIRTVRDDPVGGIIALPLADTLKRQALELDAGAVPLVPSIMRTEARADLWLAQTPQMFRVGMLREVLVRAQQEGHILTDEASAFEWLGYSPKLVQGSLRNFKVTYPDDFEVMEAMLSHQKT
ncbi:2-C-methyl-D-erythritol 4-phosphate cytidylyltransferase [Mycoavidus sp. B2-EB]|nr:2-C-methyl-D-erythritol 4-phosphate cytidylyltransferase [Mycoavidus sp. B2-EB]